jgi:hypothetical protein
VRSNHLRRNGTPSGDLTDGIRVNPGSMGNTIQSNHLRDNVTHDCHDDSVGAGSGTPPTANFWIDNHGQTQNRVGLCVGPDDPPDTFVAAAGWDPSYLWYAGDALAGEYNWPLAYLTVDSQIQALVQMLPSLGAARGRGPTSPSQ